MHALNYDFCSCNSARIQACTGFTASVYLTEQAHADSEHTYLHIFKTADVSKLLLCTVRGYRFRISTIIDDDFKN